MHSPAFSHVALVPPGSTMVLVGGQNAVDADGRVTGDDVASQAAQVFTNLDSALRAAGAGFVDVVQWRIAALEGVDGRPAVAEFQRRWDPTLPPPLISVTMVAGLAVPGALLALDAVAVLPARTEEE